MSVKKRDFDRLLRKFNFSTRQGDHLFAWLEIDGKTVVRTRRSNGRGELPALLMIRRQLHLTPKQFNEAISCTLSYNGYVALLGKKGMLSGD